LLLLVLLVSKVHRAHRVTKAYRVLLAAHLHPLDQLALEVHRVLVLDLKVLEVRKDRLAHKDL
jgi:hypothetical protein